MPVIQTIMGSMGSANIALPDPGGWFSSVDNALEGTLRVKVYDGYHNESNDLSALTLLLRANNEPSLSSGDNYRTHMFTGYAYAPTTGNYIFRTISDDGSYLWLGTTAWDGNYQINNALINNGGLHGSSTVDSASIRLRGGQWYPIRILFGNYDGNTELSVTYSLDNGSNFSNISWAYNTVTMEGFN
jgi:hypothetical protein